MNQSRRIIQGALIIGALTLSITACGQKQQLVNGSGTQPSASPAVTVLPSATPSAAPTPTPVPTLQKKVKVYFSDQEEMKLVEKEVTITYKKEADVYQTALNALKKSDDPKAVSLFEDLKFTSVAFDHAKGELKLDLAFGPKTQLGAPGEEMFLQALKKTVFQFPEVKALFVLKDGKQVDSLMGHLELPYPIKRPN
ncbi:GerMN domain-containing protein [Paenibacillus sp. GCM10023248]|uniref:GerMN domain-containing protein n=1 Tax=Bacillales TaxID=1385 RepID=UPI002378836F|nr:MULTISPECIES: GerMN domain-containing protein [Bacillales]MDD9267713.1 GerMN domain-containing protein [Paenibacillus sp. MAHUQ-63]MDR6884525.1 hypothetical protein [Bacillus sp. 3255]